MNIFHIAEVVDLGIEKEKKRRDFYATAANQFSKLEMRSLFLRLKDWEEKHIEIFSEIRKSLSDEESAESYSGELTAYMQSLIDNKLYSIVNASDFNKVVKTPFDAVQYGISFEKDAILFFSELKGYTNDAHQEVIQKLCDEEKQHVVYLVELRDKLSP